MASEKACTFISLGEVVATYVGRPAVDYQAEINRMVQYYGAGVIEEQTDICFWEPNAIKRRLQQLRPTEDAEVISTETVKKA